MFSVILSKDCQKPILNAEVLKDDNHWKPWCLMKETSCVEILNPETLKILAWQEILFKEQKGRG